MKPTSSVRGRGKDTPYKSFEGRGRIIRAKIKPHFDVSTSKIPRMRVQCLMPSLVGYP